MRMGKLCQVQVNLQAVTGRGEGEEHTDTAACTFPSERGSLFKVSLLGGQSVQVQSE